MHILRQQQDNQLRDRASEGEKEKREEKKKKDQRSPNFPVLHQPQHLQHR